MFLKANQYTWDETEALISKGAYYVLPISALEQHGRHLPVGTDDFILQTIIDALCLDKRLEADFLCLPTIKYGYSFEHMGMSGTISLSGKTLVAIIEDILDSLKRHGIQNLIVLNSHGGNSLLLNAYIYEWQRKYGIQVYTINLFNSSFLRTEDLPIETPFAQDIHAGELETSILQYCMPDAIRAEKLSEDYDVIIDTSVVYPMCDTDKISPGNGVIGAASRASADKGKDILRYIMDRLVEHMTDIVEYSSSTLNHSQAVQAVAGVQQVPKATPRDN